MEIIRPNYRISFVEPEHRDGCAARGEESLAISY